MATKVGWKEGSVSSRRESWREERKGDFVIMNVTQCD